MSSEVIKKDDPFFIVHEHRKKAVKYAISSLETDEAYQLEYESTIKNDLPHCQHTDKEIAKSFIEDVEAVKEHLPCGEQMDFPNTFDEFAKSYGFRDKKEIYTNGSELIPVFRVKQWLEHISTTKNDLAVDCISREAVLEQAYAYGNGLEPDGYCVNVVDIQALPPVTPIKPKGHWICDGKGRNFADYHCSECGLKLALCGQDIKQRQDSGYSLFCGGCGADMRGEE